MLKLSFSCAILLLCIAANSPMISIIIALMMMSAIIFFGGISVPYILSLMKIPIAFLLLNSLPIAVNLSRVPMGFCDFPLFGIYLSLTAVSLAQAARLFLKAYASVTCLAFIALSTPINEIIHLMKKLKVPAILIELMYLIYRYIFVLSDTLHTMTIAAESRLGFESIRSSWYSFSQLGGNLLASSFRRSGACFDAMESRCYDGKLCFLTRETPILKKHLIVFSLCFILCFSFTCILKWKGWDLF